jgi:hypothetical protein
MMPCLTIPHMELTLSTGHRIEITELQDSLIDSDCPKQHANCSQVQYYHGTESCVIVALKDSSKTR